MIELTGMQIFNVVFALVAGLIGYWNKRLREDITISRTRLDELQRELAQLREQWARDAAEYARRHEIETLISRIETKIDRLSDRLDSKQDK